LCTRSLSLLPDLTVAENLFLGRLPVDRVGLVSRKVVRAQARRALAFRNARKDPEDVPVVGLGFSTSGLVGLEDGSLYGTICQSVEADGALAIEHLAKSLDGDLVPKEEFIPSDPITVENMHEYTPGWS
jgi:ABC-type sugar transport system substrate-binding protein